MYFSSQIDSVFPRQKRGKTPLKYPQGTAHAGSPRRSVSPSVFRAQNSVNYLKNTPQGPRNSDQRIYLCVDRTSI